MEATVQEGVLNKYSDEVHEMVRNQIEAFKKYSVAWLSHENIMVLSKSIGLIPVKAENVLKFLEKICETHRNGSLCDVEAERNQLAGSYKTVTSLTELIQLKKHSFALSYVQTERDENDRPHYHASLCRSLRYHFGVQPGKPLPQGMHIWFDQLAKYQNPKCRNSAWGKMGNLPYMDVSVLAILPMCCECDVSPRRLTIPLLGCRFPLDLYLKGIIRFLSKRFLCIDEQNISCAQNEFFGELTSIVDQSFVQTALESCVKLYGKKNDEEVSFPFFSSWFRSWPMLERYTGRAYKGLYMDRHSWQVAALVVAIMDAIGTAINLSLSSEPGSKTIKLVEEVENLREASLQPIIDANTEPVKLLKCLSPGEAREYQDLVDETYSTIMNVQFYHEQPENYAQVISSLKKRLSKRNIHIPDTTTSIFNWEDKASRGALCEGYRTLGLLRMSFVTHADIFSVADKVDIMLGLLSGIGGSNNVSRLENCVFYDSKDPKSLIIAPEQEIVRVVEMSLVKGNERRSNDVPLLSLSPLVNMDTLESWLRVYLNFNNVSINNTKLSIQQRIIEQFETVIGYVCEVNADLGCELWFCPATDLTKEMKKWTECSCSVASKLKRICGVVQYAMFHDSVGSTVNFVWLIEKLKNNAGKMCSNERVSHQLSWRSKPDTTGASESFSSRLPVQLTKEIEKVLSFQQMSNPVVFWREGDKAAGIPMEFFIDVLLEGLKRYSS